MGPCNSLVHNPQTGVECLGHSNGVVSFWTPSSGSEAAARVLAHPGPITALAADRSGQYLVTGGVDGTVKVWDVRMLKKVFTYHVPSLRPVTSLALSECGMLAFSFGDQVTVFKDALTSKQSHPYMSHTLSAIHSRIATQSAVTLSTGSASAAVLGSESLGTHRSGLMSRSSYEVTTGKGGIRNLLFCPYQDVLALGHGAGVSTIISLN